VGFLEVQATAGDCNMEKIRPVANMLKGKEDRPMEYLVRWKMDSVGRGVRNNVVLCKLLS